MALKLVNRHFIWLMFSGFPLIDLSLWLTAVSLSAVYSKQGGVLPIFHSCSLLLAVFSLNFH
jgi:hypothetical protein